MIQLESRVVNISSALLHSENPGDPPGLPGASTLCPVPQPPNHPVTQSPNHPITPPLSSLLSCRYRPLVLESVQACPDLPGLHSLAKSEKPPGELTRQPFLIRRSPLGNGAGFFLFTAPPPRFRPGYRCSISPPNASLTSHNGRDSSGISRPRLAAGAADERQGGERGCTLFSS